MALKPSHRSHDKETAPALQIDQAKNMRGHRANPFAAKQNETHYAYSPSSSSFSIASEDSEAREPRSLPPVSVHYYEDSMRKPQRRRTIRREPAEDLPPIVTHTVSTSSVDTYDSEFSRDDGDEVFDDGDDDDDGGEDEGHDTPYYNLVRCPGTSAGAGQPCPNALASSEEDAIPVVLPPYRASVVDPTVRPSTPRAFGRLFPSLDRLSVKHDDLTSDGNMNLRIDTLVPASALVDDLETSEPGVRGHSGSRRPLSIQLYHLRMHDLPRREFSLRRYCRESGREVCSSKRIYEEVLTVGSRPTVRRSVSSVIRSVTIPFQRASSHSTHHHVPGIFHRRPSTISRAEGAASPASSSTSSSRGSCHNDESRRRRESVTTTGSSINEEHRPKALTQRVTTEKIRLEFSNYARVDVTRLPDKDYEFDWWGSHYTWRRSVNQDLAGAVSFHLVRDQGRGITATVAHIVPENRSPNQISGEEEAGGWVPPCHLWISDESVLESATDVADVIIGTGLISLVDDCIKQRWPTKPVPRRSSFGFPNAAREGESRSAHRNALGAIFNRRHSDQQGTSRLRFGRSVFAY
jgi:hypothetical protein